MTNTEATTIQAASPAQKREPTTKPNSAPPKPRVAPSQGKSAKKTTPAKKAAKTAKAAKKLGQTKPKGARQGSKSATVVNLLKRPGGATLKELMQATGWQAHSMRGFLSGTIGKKMCLELTSTKGQNGERGYSVKA